MHLLVFAHLCSHSLTAFCANKRFIMQLSSKHAAFVQILVSIHEYMISWLSEAESLDGFQTKNKKAEITQSWVRWRRNIRLLRLIVWETNELAVQSITFSAPHPVCRNVLVHSTGSDGRVQQLVKNN